MKPLNERMKDLENLMIKHERFGATDSEGYHCLRFVDQQIRKGRKVELTMADWQLYSTEPGWSVAAQELIDEASAISSEYSEVFKGAL